MSQLFEMHRSVLTRSFLLFLGLVSCAPAMTPCRTPVDCTSGMSCSSGRCVEIGAGGGAAGAGGGAAGAGGGAAGAGGGAAGAGGGAAGAGGGAAGAGGGAAGAGGGADAGAPSIDAGLPSLGNPCMNAIPVTGRFTTGTTVDAGNGFRFLDTGDCQGSNSLLSARGTDRVYSVNIPAGQRLVATLTNGVDGGATSVDSTLNLVVGLNNCGASLQTADAGVVTTGIRCAAAANTPRPQKIGYLNSTAVDQTGYIIIDSVAATGFAMGFSFGLDLVFDRPPALNGGEACVSPVTLPLGMSVIGSTTGAVDDYRFPISSTGCGPTSNGPDRVYSVTVPNEYRLTVRTLGLTGGFKPVMNVIAEAARCATGNLGGSNATATPVCLGNSVANTSGAPITYLLLLDAAPDSTTSSGYFEISANLTQLPPPLPGDRCTAPIAVAASGTLTNQTTIGFSDDIKVPIRCTAFYGSNGPDKVYSVVIPPNQRLQATVTPTSSWDPLIYLMEPSSCGPYPTCVGTGSNAGSLNVAETVRFENSSTMPRTVFIVVDSPGSDDPSIVSGIFDLSVQIMP
jgi:hypothetical protein